MHTIPEYKRIYASLASGLLVLLLALVFACPQTTLAAEQRKAASVKIAKQPNVKKQASVPKQRQVSQTQKQKTAKKQIQKTQKKSIAGKNRQSPPPTSLISKKTNKQAIRPPAQVYGSADIAKQISAQSVVIIDARSGQLIWAKDPDEPRQPASTIKVITGLIAINSLKRHDVVPVSEHAAQMPRSKIYLDTQQFYLADDLINAVLLASANDASVALAEKIAGSEEQFAQLMSQHAKKWGAQNTICQTASGLTAEGQQTTARDLALIFRHAMGNKDFVQRMGKRSGSTSCGKALNNHNKALWRIDGAVAGKTGFTNAARQTYVGQFTRNGQSIIVALMGSETMWVDLKKLVEHGFREKGAESGQLAQQSNNMNKR